MNENPCVFCEINTGRAPATFVHEWSDTFAIKSLDPIVEGHTLVIPKTHVRDFAADPEIYARTSQRAGELMRWTNRPMVVMTLRGEEAGQQVMHLHLHLIPREAGDGLRIVHRPGKGKKS